MLEDFTQKLGKNSLRWKTEVECASDCWYCCNRKFWFLTQKNFLENVEFFVICWIESFVGLALEKIGFVKAKAETNLFANNVDD